MSMHDIAARAKRTLPVWIWSPGRKFLTALLTPIRFGLFTGHARSSLLAAAVDRHGAPIPWYTYPAVDFLDTKDFTGKSILEFGAGQSTLWWSKRARRVVSLESNVEWHGRLRPRIPGNVQLHLVPDDLTGIESQLAEERFDVIIIDGLDRLKAASLSLPRLASDGAIFLDNSDVTWGGEKTATYPILDLFRASNFSRVDFYGFAPGVVLPHCTSLFFRGGSFIIRGEENPIREKMPRG